MKLDKMELGKFFGEIIIQGVKAGLDPMTMTVILADTCKVRELQDKTNYNTDSQVMISSNQDFEGLCNEIAFQGMSKNVYLDTMTTIIASAIKVREQEVFDVYKHVDDSDLGEIPVPQQEIYGVYRPNKVTETIKIPVPQQEIYGVYRPNKDKEIIQMPISTDDVGDKLEDNQSVRRKI